MRRLPLLVLVIAAASYFLVAQAGPPAAEPYQSDPVVLAGEAGASYNWAGYVAEGGHYTAVSGTWTVPEVSQVCADLCADATWVGIGGVSSQDLIQAGTQALVDAEGTVVYQAWWEILPDPSQPLSLRVHPGDSITTAVTYAGSGIWRIDVINNTTGRRAEITTPYRSSFSSAEWIEEAPSLALAGQRHKPLIPLSGFGSVVFERGSTVVDGAAVTIAGAGAEPMMMVSRGGGMLAAPSVLDGGGFSVVQSGVEYARAGAFPL